MAGGGGGPDTAAFTIFIVDDADADTVAASDTCFCSLSIACLLFTLDLLFLLGPLQMWPMIHSVSCCCFLFWPFLSTAHVSPDSFCVIAARLVLIQRLRLLDAALYVIPIAMGAGNVDGDDCVRLNGCGTVVSLNALVAAPGIIISSCSFFCCCCCKLWD